MATDTQVVCGFCFSAFQPNNLDGNNRRQAALSYNRFTVKLFVHNKQEIVNENLLGGWCYGQLAQKDGIRRTTIYGWAMEFEGRGIPEKRVVERITSPPIDTEKNQSLLLLLCLLLGYSRQALF